MQEKIDRIRIDAEYARNQLKKFLASDDADNVKRALDALVRIYDECVIAPG